MVPRAGFIGGQYSDAVRVIAFNTAEGWRARSSSPWKGWVLGVPLSTLPEMRLFVVSANYEQSTSRGTRLSQTAAAERGEVSEAVASKFQSSKFRLREAKSAIGQKSLNLFGASAV
jgi:hypothetical protein